MNNPRTSEVCPLPRRHRRRTAFATSVLLATGLVSAVQQPSASAEIAPVTVTVNTRAGLATMSEIGLGVNHAIWDAHLGTEETSDLLRAAGVRMLRYPGGSYADIYHWKDHTAPGGYVAPNTDFDTFMAAARRVGAEPMIVANYGTGTPEEAAEWVRYANLTKRYGVTYWTIGNENYGNGLYGASWEADEHPDKRASYYAQRVVEYVDAMKAVDPTIKVGAVVTMPGNWPDGLTAEGDPGPWNQAVLSIAGPKIDFIDVHWYPGGTAAESLARTSHIPDAIYLLREQINRFAGKEHASRIGISFTELNVDEGRNTQPGALFLADAYSGLLAHGVFTVHWWNVHNGIGTVSTVAGQTDYGDFGLLSSGGCTPDGSVCQPPVNTPFAPYHALSMMNLFAQAGDQFIRAETDQPLVSAHAVRRRNGDLAVLLLNKDPDHSYAVTVDYAGFAPASGAPTVHTYRNGGTEITTTRKGSATRQTLPPYSLTTLVVRGAPALTGQPSAPGQPTVREITDRSVTISWPPATPGRSPIAKYEVYRQHGAVSEQLGRPTAPRSPCTTSSPARDTQSTCWRATPPAACPGRRRR